MYSAQLFLTVLIGSAYGLDVGDIFPQELITQGDVSPRHEDFGLDIVSIFYKWGAMEIVSVHYK